ncbi:MAG: antitoxin [Candidatus Nanopelagicales bacterium]
MSFIDKAKEAISENLDKAKDLVAENFEKVEYAINTAGHFVDEKSSGRFHGINGRGIAVTDFPWAEIYPYLAHNKTVCRGILGPVVATQGSGPYTEAAFDQFLANCGIELRTISGDEPPEVVVLGSQDWSGDDLDEMRENCFGDIRVYSQEMVVASMAIGADIFDFDSEGETIFDFIMGHPALEYFHKDGVFVPGLAIDEFEEDPDELSDQAVDTLRVEFAPDAERPAVGILGDMGYRVGKVKGLPRRERREILWRTFRVQLTATSPWTEEYINEWGPRCSPVRFTKMRNVLRSLIKNAERKTAIDMSVAIAEWKEDVQFLLEKKAEWLTHSH